MQQGDIRKNDIDAEGVGEIHGNRDANLLEDNTLRNNGDKDKSHSWGQHGDNQHQQGQQWHDGWQSQGPSPHQQQSSHEHGRWQNRRGDWEWWERTDPTSTSSTSTTRGSRDGDEEDISELMQIGGAGRRHQEPHTRVTHMPSAKGQRKPLVRGYGKMPCTTFSRARSGLEEFAGKTLLPSSDILRRRWGETIN